MYINISIPSKCKCKSAANAVSAAAAVLQDYCQRVKVNEEKK